MFDLSTRRLFVLGLSLLLLSSATSCFNIVQHAAGEVLPIPPSSEPLPLSIDVEPLRGETQYAKRLREPGLVSALRDTHVFKQVQFQETGGGDADLIVRGSVEPTWNDGGRQNFMTFFPGGLIFAPSWRGIRWQLDLDASLELLDGHSGNVLHTIETSSSYETIHRTGNPLHFVSAALVVPAIIRASLTTWPRGNYQKRAFRQAYPALWEEVAHELARDRLRAAMRPPRRPAR